MGGVGGWLLRLSLFKEIKIYFSYYKTNNPRPFSIPSKSSKVPQVLRKKNPPVYFF